MAAKDKSKVDQDAIRISEWLVDNRTEFEQEGIGEDRIAAAIGIPEAAAKEAVDHLENREEVVRWPQSLSTPPRFLIKPGRIWPKTRDEVIAKRPAG